MADTDRSSVNTGQIHVDKDELARQIRILEDMWGDNRLRTYYANNVAPIISFSARTAINTIKTASQDLQDIVMGMFGLIDATIDVLNNTHMRFVDADEGLAQQLHPGTLEK